MRSFRGRMTLLSVLLLLLGAWEIYTAKLDLGLTANERTTRGTVKFDPQRKNDSDTLFNTLTLRCDFYFEVDGGPYVGHEICPKQMIATSKSSPMDYVGGPVQSVTVYYDPSNPSTNSMMDFTTRSKWDFTKAKLFIIVGFLLLLFSQLSTLFSRKGNSGGTGEAIDSEGAAIPEESREE
jgi:hypothetical protein